jgi:hypothetical protein
MTVAAKAMTELEEDMNHIMGEDMVAVEITAGVDTAGVGMTAMEILTDSLHLGEDDGMEIMKAGPGVENGHANLSLIIGSRLLGSRFVLGFSKLLSPFVL